jgi:hypothetical protein
MAPYESSISLKGLTAKVGTSEEVYCESGGLMI